MPPVLPPPDKNEAALNPVTTSTLKKFDNIINTFQSYLFESIRSSDSEEVSVSSDLSFCSISGSFGAHTGRLTDGCAYILQ